MKNYSLGLTKQEYSKELYAFDCPSSSSSLSRPNRIYFYHKPQIFYRGTSYLPLAALGEFNSALELRSCVMMG